MCRALVLNGPNMNMLGQREPQHYGRFTLSQLEDSLRQVARELGIVVSFLQSNYEGKLVEVIQNAEKEYDFVVINPAAYTHYSIAIRDAIAASNVPFIEVHLSNVFGREDFRSKSMTASVCYGMICGLGATSYELALRAGYDITLSKNQ